MKGTQKDSFRRVPTSGSAGGRLLVALSCAIGWLQISANQTAAQSPTVRLEIVASPKLAITAQHDWLRKLGDRSFASVRIRTAGMSGLGARQPRLPSPSISQSPDGSLEVTGVLTARNELALPGLLVSLGDVKRIDDWLDSLAAPAAKIEQPTHAFGLSAEQLIQVHNALSPVVAQTTAGKPASDVIEILRESTALPFVVASSATKGMSESFELDDELEGVSTGTALAAALRPLGLVMVPRAVGGRLELVLAGSGQADEFWPIGWPPERKPDELAPDLFKFIPLDIRNARLLDALNAIGSRLQIPMLFDHNGLARAEIDVAEARVTFGPTKTYYQRALERLLYQAKLKGELRVDEQGRAFYWISPRR